MIIKLNGYVLNDPATQQVYLDEPIDGLALPPIRTSSGNYSGRDGGYVGAQFYGMRLVTLTGFVFSNTVATLEAQRKALGAALTGSGVTVTITTNAGASYLLNCYLDSFDMPINRTVTQAPFKISLIAPDPIIYDNISGVLSATLQRLTGGGLTWPLTWPLTWATGSVPTNIVNGGTVAVYPTITLYGTMTNPTITNTTTGALFQLFGFTSGPTDTVIIDFKNRTVLLNGGPIFQYVGTASTWWVLSPGNNNISLTTSSGSDTVTATITWQSGYAGI